MTTQFPTLQRIPGRVRPWHFLASVAFAGIVALGGHQGGVASQILAPQSATPDAGRVPVIAEAVIEMPDDSIIWSVAAIEAGARPIAVASDGEPGFVLATQGAAVVRGGVEPETRLKKGEAIEVRSEDSLTVQTAGASPARVALITLSPAESSDEDVTPAADADDKDAASQSAEAFASPGGNREVELLRAVLDESETAAIKSGEAPTFVLVTGGSADIATKEGEPKTLKAGESALVEGEIVVTGAKARSSFVAVVIGDEVESNEEVAGPTPTTRGQSGPQPTSPPAEPTAVPPTPTPEGNGPNDDPDGDGLLNSEEDTFGTDRRNPDSDADLLSDGEEVHHYLSGPTVLDTDADGLYDGDEVIRVGSDPIKPDTDGDGLTDKREVDEVFTNALDDDTDHDDYGDYQEVVNGTDPRVQDTDGDGIAEGQEVTQYFTNPLVYDSDGDGFGDGDEVYYYGTDPVKADTDDDGLTDTEEAFLTTQPGNPDTDGDGYNDGAEVYQYHTLATDPTSHP